MFDSQDIAERQYDEKYDDDDDGDDAKSCQCIDDLHLTYTHPANNKLLHKHTTPHHVKTEIKGTSEFRNKTEQKIN